MSAEVRNNGLVDRLKRLFLGGEAPDDSLDKIGDVDLHDLPALAEHAERVLDFIRRVGEQDATSVVAGCVQLIGLEQIKARLGEQWAEVADRAMFIAQETIDQHLGAGDVYRIVGDDSFQICFESGDEPLARSQVSTISTAISDRIAQEIKAGELTVDSFVAPVSYARIRDSADPLSELYSSLLDIRNAVNNVAVSRHSIPALRYAGALFQPLWSSRDFGVTQNRCLLDNLTGAAAAKYLIDLDDLDDLAAALANIDCVMFAKSIEGLHHALGDIKQATIVIPVHFQTLALEQPDFMEIAATLPLPYRRFVLLDLIGVPTAASARDILRALKTGRAIADRIVLQMPATDRRLEQQARNLVWGASMNLAELDHEDPLILRDLTRFAATAAECGLYSFAYGANTMAKGVAVVDAGFDYVGGSAVAPTAPAPRSHARFTPLFGDVAPKVGDFDQRAGLREHPRFAPVNPNSTVTLPNGDRHDCRIPNVSASGAVVICGAAVTIGDYLVIGSIPSQVVRATKRGFAVRFLEVQQPSAVEVALQTPLAGDQLLQSLRLLKVQMR